MNEMCQKVLEASKDYWRSNPENRAIAYRWLEEHVERCDDCALRLQDVAEAMLAERRK